jgi:hypothetical protein
MRHVVVRYRVKTERAEENQQLVTKVFEELNARDPGGVRYMTFRLADGVSFVHVASYDGADGSNPIAETPAFGEFLRDIAARCDEPPSSQEATVVGSYRFFDEGSRA